MRIVVLCVSLVLVVQVSLFAENVELKNGDKILWIGNSFSDWFGWAPEVLSQLLKASDPPIEIEWKFMVKGQGILKEYHECVMSPDLIGQAGERGGSAPDTIAKGGWDYVIVQGWEDAFRRKDWETAYCSAGQQEDYLGWPAAQDTFVKYAKLFYEEITAVGAEMILYFPHMCINYDSTGRAHAWETYNKAVEETGCYLMPSILAWDSVAVDRDTNLVPFLSGGIEDGEVKNSGHQNGNGQALCMYFAYTYLTNGRSPVGLTQDLQPSQFTPAWYDTYTPQDQGYLQSVAYAKGMQWLNGEMSTPVLVRTNNVQAPGVSVAEQIFTINGRKVTGTRGNLNPGVFMKDPGNGKIGNRILVRP